MLKMSAPCTIIDTKVVAGTASAFDQIVPSALQAPEAGTFSVPWNYSRGTKLSYMIFHLTSSIMVSTASDSSALVASLATMFLSLRQYSLSCNKKKVSADCVTHWYISLISLNCR